MNFGNAIILGSLIASSCRHSSLSNKINENILECDFKELDQKKYYVRFEREVSGKKLSEELVVDLEEKSSYQENLPKSETHKLNSKLCFEFEEDWSTLYAFDFNQHLGKIMPISQLKPGRIEPIILEQIPFEQEDFLYRECGIIPEIAKFSEPMVYDLFLPDGLPLTSESSKISFDLNGEIKELDLSVGGCVLLEGDVKGRLIVTKEKEYESIINGRGAGEAYSRLLLTAMTSNNSISRVPPNGRTPCATDSLWSSPRNECVSLRIENDLYKLEKNMFVPGEDIQLLTKISAPKPVDFSISSIESSNFLQNFHVDTHSLKMKVPALMPSGIYEVGMIRTSENPPKIFSKDYVSDTYQNTEIKILRFQIVNKGVSDTTEPSITNVKWSSTEIGSMGEITLSLDLTDDLSGVTSKFIIISFKGSSEANRAFYFNQIDGIHRTLSIKRADLALPIGTYKTTLEFWDDVGNRAQYPSIDVKILP